ncbi:TIR domain-containing protein [Cohnella candidum]|uniref:TIR domain-containing protein n=1 Tax=Cohnella candidum TaxID=2674991 RepID=UPI0013DE57E1|nr:TIR domain-containing protein [Cohnella candidum]
MSNDRERERTYKLYLSHTWNHNHSVRELKSFMDAEEAFRYQSYSISPHHPVHAAMEERKLYELIKSKMKFCDAVILLCGVYPSYSRWINKELIACKEELRKPLIAVERYGSAKTSLLVKENADLIVDWNAEAITGAIRKLVEP